MNKILIAFLAAMVLFSPGPVRSGTPLTEVHPGWDLMTIRPTDFVKTQNERNYDEFTYGISAMDFLSDGRLVAATYFCERYVPGDLGLHADPLSIFILDGVQGDDRDEISTVEIPVGFRDMHGLEVINDTIYVLHKQKITRCVDGGGDAWTCASIWDVPDYLTVDQNHDLAQAEKLPGMGQFHQFNFGMPYKEGFFYIGLGTCIWGCDQDEERNSVLKVAKDGSSYDFHSGGHRMPDGLAFGPEGRLFVTENQGGWMPSSKLIQTQEGRFYGFRGNGDNYFQKQNIPESPPAVWIRQNDIGNSPTRPHFLTEGPYAGQMLIGDNFYGGIQRYFLERVNGEYQGCVFRFSGGFEAAVQVIIPGPDGALYLGELGGPGGNWKWRESSLSWPPRAFGSRR